MIHSHLYCFVKMVEHNAYVPVSYRPPRKLRRYNMVHFGKVQESGKRLFNKYTSLEHFCCLFSDVSGKSLFRRVQVSKINFGNSADVLGIFNAWKLLKRP